MNDHGIKKLDTKLEIDYHPFLIIAFIIFSLIFGAHHIAICSDDGWVEIWGWDWDSVELEPGIFDSNRVKSLVTMSCGAEEIKDI